jgi:hypothetical protein
MKRLAMVVLGLFLAGVANGQAITPGSLLNQNVQISGSLAVDNTKLEHGSNGLGPITVAGTSPSYEFGVSDWQAGSGSPCAQYSIIESNGVTGGVGFGGVGTSFTLGSPGYHFYAIGVTNTGGSNYLEAVTYKYYIADKNGPAGFRFSTLNAGLVTLPLYVKACMSGTTLLLSDSTDGLNWTTVQSITVSTLLSSSVGFVTWSGDQNPEHEFQISAANPVVQGTPQTAQSTAIQQTTSEGSDYNMFSFAYPGLRGNPQGCIECTVTAINAVPAGVFDISSGTFNGLTIMENINLSALGGGSSNFAGDGACDGHTSCSFSFCDPAACHTSYAGIVYSGGPASMSVYLLATATGATQYEQSYTVYWPSIE